MQAICGSGQSEATDQEDGQHQVREGSGHVDGLEETQKMSAPSWSPAGSMLHGPSAGAQSPFPWSRCL